MSQFEEGVDMEELFDCYTTIRDDAKVSVLPVIILQALSVFARHLRLTLASRRCQKSGRF